MIQSKGRQLSEAYFQALMCDGDEVFRYFSKVEEIVAGITSQRRIRRALDRAVRKAAKLESKGCQCQ